MARRRWVLGPLALLGSQRERLSARHASTSRPARDAIRPTYLPVRSSASALPPPCATALPPCCAPAPVVPALPLQAMGAGHGVGHGAGESPYLQPLLPHTSAPISPMALAEAPAQLPPRSYETPQKSNRHHEGLAQNEHLENDSPMPREPLG